MNLRKYSVYAKQLIDGMPSSVFSALTFPPNKKNNEVFQARYEKILSVSREKYSKSRKSVEGRITKNMEDIEKQEILIDFLQELKELNQLKEIETLESKVAKNLDENLYSELIRLKSQLNRD